MIWYIATKKEVAMMKNFLKMLLVMIISTACSTVIEQLGVGNESIVMVFLLGVLFSAVLTCSRSWAATAAVLSTLVFNLLFTEPRYTLHVYNASDLILLGFFLVTAIVAGTITSRLQTQMKLAGSNEKTAQTMYKIASGFLSASGTNSVIKKGKDMVHEYIGIDGYVLLGERTVGGVHEYPIVGASGIQGKLVLDEEPEPQKVLMIQALCTQLGIALEREKLVKEREEISIAMERERQRSMLLRSIAHDLRSPLTALSGSGSLLADNYEVLTDGERKKLACNVSEETVWLIDLVENILGMTRITEDKLVLNKQDEVIDDIVEEAVKHTERLFKENKLQVTLPDEILTAPMDGKLIAQVIINLLENAVCHTPQGTDVALSVCENNGSIAVSVADNGEGVPYKIKAKLFEKFATQNEDIVDGKMGLGLGLAICKTIVEAHGGTISYADNIPHGSVFTFMIPMEDVYE